MTTEDRIYTIPGASPRLTIRRHLEGHAYAANGNTHNPTPRYSWHLLADGTLVDHADRKSVLVAAARENGGAYLSVICPS